MTSRFSLLATVLVAGITALSSACKPAGYRLSGTLADTVPLADSAQALCSAPGVTNQQKCYEDFIMPLVASRGVKVAMGTLHRIGDHQPAVAQNSHVYAHGVGITAGKLGGNVAETFASCSEIYQSGCYHGVIQAYFETVRTVDTAAVNSLCAPYAVAGGDRWLRFQCVHGMGHGLTMFYAHNLPQALTGCDMLADGWDRESCFGGAFMENVVNATNPHHPAGALRSTRDSGGGGDTAKAAEDHHHHGAAPAAVAAAAPFKALDPNDKQYPCSIVDVRYESACYIMQSSVMLKYNNGDIAKTARDCEAAPRTMPYFCHQSMGRDISALSRNVAAEAIRMCSLASEEFQPWCHIGVVKDYVFLAAKAEDGINYCKALTGPRNKAACYEAVGQQIATLRNGNAERTALCQPSERAYRDNCLFGAQAGGNATGIPRPRTS
jgi:hypothetical protein